MKVHFAPLIYAAVFLTLPVHADPIFEDDFNSAEDLRGLVQWTGNKDRTADEAGAWMEVKADEENHFEEGAENRVLVLNDRSESEAVNLYAVFQNADNVISMSFDFFEPHGFDAGPAIIRIGTARNEPAELAVELAMGNGKIEGRSDGLYSLGQKQRLTIVANNSNDPVAYGDRELPSQHYDVFIGKDQVLQAVPFNTQDANLPPGVPLTALRILTYIANTKDQTFFIDNFKVENGAHAP